MKKVSDNNNMEPNIMMLRLLVLLLKKFALLMFELRNFDTIETNGTVLKKDRLVVETI
jgi:hypothetical protein